MDKDNLQRKEKKRKGNVTVDAKKRFEPRERQRVDNRHLHLNVRVDSDPTEVSTGVINQNTFLAGTSC
jgi:hypothetical protein